MNKKLLVKLIRIFFILLSSIMISNNITIGGWESQNMNQQLNGIWGSSSTDVFAVCDSGTILHYDGNTWSRINIGYNLLISGIWGSSGDNIFAVGEDGEERGTQQTGFGSFHKTKTSSLGLYLVVCPTVRGNIQG